MEESLAQLSLVALRSWLASHGLRILLVVVLGYALLVFVRRLVPQIIRHTIVEPVAEEDKRQEADKRAITLSNVIVHISAWVVIVIATFMILSELGLDITPILAGAGVVGIAVGLGAQTLVRDIISGLFILLENQYAKGDVVNVAGIGGLVEQVSLRRTILRDLDGTVHNVPNGEIRIASNLTREWSRVNMNISVSYGADLDRVIQVINRVGEEMAQDPEFGPIIISPPRVLRVDAFEDSGIAIKILGETKPIRQWDVMGELRKRIKKAFDEARIEIPYPHRVVIIRSEDLDPRD